MEHWVGQFGAGDFSDDDLEAGMVDARHVARTGGLVGFWGDGKTVGVDVLGHAGVVQVWIELAEEITWNHFAVEVGEALGVVEFQLDADHRSLGTAVGAAWAE